MKILQKHKKASKQFFLVSTHDKTICFDTELQRFETTPQKRLPL